MNMAEKEIIKSLTEKGVININDALSVCKIKSHKRCATKISESCKWTTVDSIPRDLLSDDAEVDLSLFSRPFAIRFYRVGFF